MDIETKKAIAEANLRTLQTMERLGTQLAAQYAEGIGSLATLFGFTLHELSLQTGLDTTVVEGFLMMQIEVSRSKPGGVDQGAVLGAVQQALRVARGSPAQ